MMPKKPSDADCMRLAIAKAGEGILRGQAPFGACIVRKGRVIAVSHNQVMGKNTEYLRAHAEICAHSGRPAGLKDH
jgi:tRNA(Arg) A34 adenosine deaminase TadA